MKKIKLSLIFGGKSGEHEISIISARSIYSAIDKNKYQIIPIAITQEGNWLNPKISKKLLKNQKITKISDSLITNNQQLITNIKILKDFDINFPVLHGPFGEDGTIQGFFEIFNVPYVGSEVLGSALSMDKIISKKIFAQNKLPILSYLEFINPLALNSKNQKIKSISNSLSKLITNNQKLIANLGLPIFIKPANMGSSVGVSKIKKTKDLKKALDLAFQYDHKIIIEKGLENAREIECAVLGNYQPKASILGEIIPSREFYDYNAKYIDNKSKIIIPAKLPKKINNKIQKIAIQAFRALNCFGLARVDFLIQKKTHKIYLNEINTMPGFTSISMYPKLWQATGISYPKLIDKLIQLGFERYHQKKALKYKYQ